MAKFRAITRLSRKLVAKIFPVAGGGSLAKRFALFQAAPNSNGEYQRPPTRKADVADARIAQGFMP